MDLKTIKSGFLMIIALSCVMAAGFAETILNEDGIKTFTNRIHEINKNQNSSSNHFYISPSNFINSNNDLSEPFAPALNNKITDTLKGIGLSPAPSDAEKFNGWEIEGYWTPRKDKTYIRLSATLWKNGRETSSFSFGYNINALSENIRELSAKNDAKTWGRTIANKLRGELPAGTAHKLHFNDFDAIGNTDAGLSLNITTWLQQFFDNSTAFQTITPYEELTETSRPVLEQRLTKLHKNNSSSLVSKLTNIEMELFGRIKQSDDGILILTHIKNKNGRNSDTVSVEFSKELLPAELLNKKQKRHEIMKSNKKQKSISKNGLTLDIASNRGSKSPIFDQYDTKRFFATTNKDAYIYIFSLPKNSEASEHSAFLLYPADAIPTITPQQKLAMLDTKNILGQNSDSSLITKLDIIAVATEDEIKTPLDGISTIVEYHRFTRRALEKARRNNTGYAQTQMSIAVMKQRN